MSMTIIMNQQFTSYGIYDQMGKNLLYLKRNESTFTENHAISVIFDGELFNYNELLDLICGENYDNIEDKIDYLRIVVNPLNYDKADNNYAILLIYLFAKYGMEQMIQMIDGSYTFILFDKHTLGDYSNLYVVNDPFGTKKIYMITEKNDILSKKMASNKNIYTLYDSKILFTNNLKDIDDVLNIQSCDSNNVLLDKYNIKELKSGTYYHYNMSYKVLSNWKLYTKRHYYMLPYNNHFDSHDISQIKTRMQKLLFCSLEKRLKNNNSEFAYKYENNSYLRKFLQKYYGKSINGYNAINIALLKQGINYQEIEEDPSTMKIIVDDYVQNVFIEEIQTNVIDAILQFMNESVLFVEDGIDKLFGNAYSETEDIIEFDTRTRTSINNLSYNELNDTNKKVYNPFFDKELLQYYFSIPLKIRFEYRCNNDLLFCEEDHL